jgi:hypothetical protein
MAHSFGKRKWACAPIFAAVVVNDRWLSYPGLATLPLTRHLSVRTLRGLPASAERWAVLRQEQDDYP